jgi:hypothetical protein
MMGRNQTQEKQSKFKRGGGGKGGEERNNSLVPTTKQKNHFMNFNLL